jgi:hypothetical protein
MVATIIVEIGHTVNYGGSTSSCLLIVDLQNRSQTELMRALARLLRQEGCTVVVSVARKGQDWVAL